MTPREGGRGNEESSFDPPAVAPSRRGRDASRTREGSASGPLPAPTRGDCLPGCTATHVDDTALGFVLCDAPITRLDEQDRRLAVSASRVVEPGAPVFTSVALSVDDGEAVELDPAVARALAAALASAAAVTGAER